MKSKRGSKVRIVIQHRGVLGAFGYKGVKSLSLAQRRAALHAAADKLGWVYLARRLNALYVFNRSKHPDLAAKFKADRQYASAQAAAARMPMW